jgi:hypothetical protein
MTDTAHEPDLSIPQVAALVGVTKARVYQRINGETGAGEVARRAGCLPSHQRALTPGARMVTRVPLDVALAWRAERMAQGHAVGEAPYELLDQLLAPPPVPTLPAPPSVGLPRFTPF